MKNFYILVLAAFSVSLNAQIVEIPDPAFKAELLSLNTVIDTNGDGEIQVSEAEAVTSLSLSMCTLDNTIGIQSFVNLEQLSFTSYCNIASPVDLSGMASLKSLHFHKCSMPSVNLAGLSGLTQISHGYVHVDFVNPEGAVNLSKISYYSSGHIPMLDLSPFPNLKELSSQGTPVDAVDLSGLSQLELFRLTGAGEMTAIDLSDLTALKKFELTGADLTEIDFSNNLLLEEITIRGNNIGSMDVSMLPNLKSLDCQSNNLTSLDISGCTNLESLRCGNNQLSSLDFSNLHKLSEADLNTNLFGILDFSGLTDADSDISYDLTYNPNLASLTLKNGKQDVLAMFDGCPNLAYLCVDDIEQAYYTDLFENLGLGIQVNTYCSFAPGGNYNTITGTLTLDLDGNGCDAADSFFYDAKLTISGNAQNSITYTDENGNYNFYPQSGEFIVTPQFENPYFAISPENATINFADANNNVQTQNFCLTPIGSHKDLEITLIPTNDARPGFDANYQIIYKNKGNQPLSGSVDFGFDDAVLDLVMANPATDSQSVNQLHWNYSNLQPFETRTIGITLNVNSPMETPAVNNGDTLNFAVSINPIADDETPNDNAATLAPTVVGSFDPNDKTCLEGDAIRPEMVGGYLHYLIRFQNSGTFYAENVVVKDVIDTDKFDISTLQLTAASHSHLTRIDGNKVEFIFENIMLPAEQDDEPGSHGFVAFKIKTKPTLALNDVVENTADIFFDFNFPITTNTTSTTVSELGLGEFENASVSIAPNPVKDILHVSAADAITSVQLLDIHGRLLQTRLANDMAVSIDLTGKARGVYFAKVTTGKGIKVGKIVKE